MRLKRLTQYKDVLNFVLEDGSVYIIVRSKDGKFVCVGELYQAESKDQILALENQKCCQISPSNYFVLAYQNQINQVCLQVSEVETVTQ